MQTLVDSLVEYLHAELDGIVPVAWVRTSSTDAQSHRLKDDSLNISALEFAQVGSLEEALISLDLVGSDERQVLGWAQAVRDALQASHYTPEYQYDPDPEHPVSRHRSITWDGNALSFGVIASEDHYCHVNCTFPVRHAR